MLLHMVPDQVAGMVVDMGAGMVADKVAGMVVGMTADKKKLFLSDMLLHMVAGMVADMGAGMVADKVNSMVPDMAPALFTYFAGINFPLSLTTSGGVWNTSKRCRSSLRLWWW